MKPTNSSMTKPTTTAASPDAAVPFVRAMDCDLQRRRELLPIDEDEDDESVALGDDQEDHGYQEIPDAAHKQI
jgi:hypothetical protein